MTINMKDDLLKSAIKSLSKKFEKTNIAQIGVVPTISGRRFSTQIPKLDNVFNGGMVVGRVYELFGGEGFGKTAMALHFAKQYLDNREQLGEDHIGRKVLIVDNEGSMSEEGIEGIGIDLKDIVFAPDMDSAEESLETIETLAKTGAIGFVILDSIDTLVPQANLDKQFGKEQMGGPAKLLSQFFRRYAKPAQKLEVTSVFINQTRFKLGVQFGDPVTTGGGNALKFYASSRLQLLTPKESTTLDNAMDMTIKVHKNRFRLWSKKSQVNFTFSPYQPQNVNLNILLFCKDSSIGLTRTAGPSGFYRMSVDDEWINVGKGGMNALLNWAEQNPEKLQELYRQALIMSGVKFDAEEVTEVELEEEVILPVLEEPEVQEEE